jgi:hypothetical protein
MKIGQLIEAAQFKLFNSEEKLSCRISEES